MSALSNYAEAKALDIFFRGTAWSTKPSTLYFALLTSEPSDTGGGTEVSGTGYARVAVVCNTTNWSKVTVHGAALTNAATVAFAKARAAWGTVTHVAAYDAASGGNLILWKALEEPKTIAINESLTFDIGDLSFSFTGNIGYYLAGRFLNHLFCAVTFPTIATHYFALGTASAATGITGEGSGNNYSRKSFSNNATNWTAASATSDPQKSNAVAIDFATASGTWGGPLTSFITSADSSSIIAGTTFSRSAGDVLTSTSNGLVDGDLVRLTTSAADLPLGLATGTDYYVIEHDGASTFKLSLTPGGVAVTISDAGTGTHTITRQNEHVIWHGSLGISLTTVNSNVPGWSIGEFKLTLD